MAISEAPAASSVLQAVIPRLMERQNLTRQQARGAMEEILSGAATPSLIGMFMVALRMKGEVLEEIIGLAQAVRAMATPVRPRQGAYQEIGETGRDSLLDTCGTGGDASGTFNISTATAFVVAGCGVRVAKHCNRSISSSCGSADVVEALGVNIALTPERMAACIDEVGIGFLFAPALHSAWKYAQPVRRELRTRTVFNLLGPLCNPAGASAQVVGVYDAGVVELAARVLLELGLRRGFVVHGTFEEAGAEAGAQAGGDSGGLDEITTTGATQIAAVADGSVRTFTLHPEDAGLTRSVPSDLQGGGLAENVRILRRILDGEPGPKRDIVLLNAAAALIAAERAGDFPAGVRLASQSLDSGSAKAKLAALAEFTREG